MDETYLDSPGIRHLAWRVSEKRDEWTGETEEKRDHSDFVMRITVSYTERFERK